MSEYHVHGRLFRQPGRATWSFGLHQYMCLRDVYVQFPKSRGATLASCELLVSRFTLTYLPTYSIEDVPIHVLQRFKDAASRHKTTPIHFQHPPVELLCTPSDTEEWVKVKLPLEVLFPAGLVICCPGELSMSWTMSPWDTGDIPDFLQWETCPVLVDVAPGYAKDLVWGTTLTRVPVASVNVKQTDPAQETVHGNELRTWVYGPMIAFFPKSPVMPRPVSAIVGTFWHGVRKPEMFELDRLGDGDCDEDGDRYGHVFVRPDTWDGATGFLHVTFDGPLSNIPALTVLRSNTLKMMQGMAMLAITAEPYMPPGSDGLTFSLE
jgi:hypothetical protein